MNGNQYDSHIFQPHPLIPLLLAKRLHKENLGIKFASLLWVGERK